MAVINTIPFNGYLIEIVETPESYKYVIKDKNNKEIFKGPEGYPFPPEAEVAAKLYINRVLAGSIGGWTIM